MQPLKTNDADVLAQGDNGSIPWG